VEDSVCLPHNRLSNPKDIPMQCENCGATLPEGVKTCVKCGMRTEVSSFAANVGGAPRAAPARGSVRPPQKRSLLLPMFIVVVLIVAAWFLFQWLNAR
jgi:hypothetical protein